MITRFQYRLSSQFLLCWFHVELHICRKKLLLYTNQSSSRKTLWLISFDYWYKCTVKSQVKQASAYIYWQKNIELNKTFNFGVVNKCVILRSYTHAWGRSGTRCRANFREVWTRSSRQLQSSTILLRIPRLFKMLVPSLYPLTIWNTGYQSPDHLPLGNRKNRQSRRPKMPKTRSSDQAGEEPQLDLALINERFVQSESSTQELRDRMNKYDNKLDEMMKMLRKALSDKQP